MIKSYTRLHVNIFLDYCTCCLMMYHPKMGCLNLSKNPQTFETINATAPKGLSSYNSGFPATTDNVNEQAHLIVLTINQDTTGSKYYTIKLF